MKLFESLQLRNLSLPNRIVLSPMCMYSAKEGVMNDFHKVHYAHHAQGGAGLIMIEATGVVPEGRITSKCLGLWNDKQKEQLKNVVDFIHNYTDSKVGIQLAHAGRKASTWEGVQLSPKEGWPTLAPSPIPYKPEEISPIPLSLSEIKGITKSFSEAAERALEANVDAIEIHAAHGYLLHEFLSPLSNQREDQYGGSLENRSRFLLEITQNLNTLLDDIHPLFVRISADEYALGGWDIEESVKLSRSLKDAGVDLIDVSSGGNIHGARISVYDSYQVPFSAQIKKEVGIKTGAVGLIKTAKQAEGILENNEADLIFMGRALLRDPFLPARSAVENGETCFYPHQYERGMKI